MMPENNISQARFAEQVLRAILAVDAGQSDAVVLTRMHAGVDVCKLTVGGVWMGDTFSWRVDCGVHHKIAPGAGAEIFAGQGDALDATVAAARLCWMCGRMGEGEWSVCCLTEIW